MQQSVPIQHQEALTRVNTFVRSVYLWMTLGLTLTGITAWTVANSPYLLSFLFHAAPDGGARPTLIFYALMFSPIILAITITARIHKMQASTATFLFLLYAVLMGAFLSLILLMYSGSSIAQVFFICSGTFLACSVYGWTTKKDLTSMGSFMMMGLFGIIIASLVNIFFRSPMMHMVISYVGVLVFVGLTAYDTQKLKSMALAQPADLDAAVLRKGTIQGALILYLDFINLFIMLLHIFGRRN
ncbi:MAG: Bax inhibitor-1/YccA family protein [Desulfosarcina sp.]|nr:Bax inhibitor-1/YccA family protein [Desulfobacterales bacterium]